MNNTKSSSWLQLLCCQLVIFVFCPGLLSSQSLTVEVNGSSALEIEKLDLTLTLTETKYDFIYKNRRSKLYPGSATKAEFVARLNELKISYDSLAIKEKSNDYYERLTKTQQEKTVSTTTYRVTFDDKEKLSEFNTAKSLWKNVQILSSDFEAKNEAKTRKELTNQLLTEARDQAETVAKYLGRKPTTISNIKFLDKGSQQDHKPLRIYTLEHFAKILLEVTFDTEPIE